MAEVLHGTSQEEGREPLLESEADASSLGELRPDALVRRHRQVVGVLDAKYKDLWPRPPWHPQGPQREDLYQMAAYLSRQLAAGWGVLAYPADPMRPGTPPVETGNPWRLQGGQQVRFMTLPHDIDGAAAKLRPLLSLDLATARGA